jgi:ADP-ribose pyrophosphatase
MEETGFRVRDVRFLFKAYTSPGSARKSSISSQPSSIRRIASRRRRAGDEHEDIEVLEIPLDEAMAMIESGEIFDAKTIMLLQWALRVLIVLVRQEPRSGNRRIDDKGHQRCPSPPPLLYF